MATVLLVVIYIAFIGLGIPDSLFGTAWPAMGPALGAQVADASFVTVLISAGTVASSLIWGRKMSKLQERRYKEVTPEETVKKLKELLKKADIQVEEDWRKPSSVGTYSLRLRIKGTDIGQNGKGMTKEFAMASAYAEFFERFHERH